MNTKCMSLWAVILLGLCMSTFSATAQDPSPPSNEPIVVKVDSVTAPETAAPLAAKPATAPELTAIDSPVIPNEIEGMVLSAFAKLVAKHSWLATVIIFMGMLRFFAKPLFSMIHAFIDLSPSKTDDNAFNSLLKFFNENPLGKTLAFALDWLTSIKIKAPASK